ncbi:hypothetical protein EDD22DRAFT_850316 [Suillus occidentalis]|nr:hypothetical protein EDD22DRAFT_850303 [Suillus occidentalis]KAG1758096.1 hypothetical protein EDD22DRAFT_850316 [Suillus occidentalis]
MAQAPVNQVNFWQHNGGGANQGMANGHQGQQHNHGNGGQGNNDAPPNMEGGAGPHNLPQDDERRLFEERMFVITARVMHVDQGLAYVGGRARNCEGQRTPSSGRLSAARSPTHVPLAPWSAHALGGGETRGVEETMERIERGGEGAGDRQYVGGGGNRNQARKRTTAYLYNYLIPAWDNALRNSILLWKDISLDAVKGNTTSLLLVLQEPELFTEKQPTVSSQHRKVTNLGVKGNIPALLLVAP